MKKIKRISLMILFFLLIWISPCFGKEKYDNYQYLKVKAVIIDIDNSLEMGAQKIKAKIMEGDWKGQVIEFGYKPTGEKQHSIPLREKMQIILELKIKYGEIRGVHLVDVVRDYPIKILFAIFFMLLIAFGRQKGFRAFLAVFVTGLCIIYFFIPMILNGHGFIYTTIIVSSVITIISFIIIDGFSRKSFSAIVGTMGGTIVSGILAVYFGNLTYITGISDDLIDIIITNSTQSLDFQGLLYSGITIGALGAVMDVSMTITSVIFELKKNNPTMRRSKLFFSGLSVGRDIMATMTNTLILAYAGTSLPLFLLFTFSDMAFIDIINLEYIATEMIRSLCGSIGLILTIPITSVAAVMNTINRK